MRTLLLFLLLFVCLDAQTKLSSEENLQSNYKTKFESLFYSVPVRYFKGAEKTKIAYKIFTTSHPKASVVISSGRTEGMVKYQELIYDLNQNGYDVYIADHRGQGYSQRLLADRQKGHVERFENYVTDLHTFVENFVPKEPKKVLLGHSMGGAIAILYAERYPHDFDALIVSSPMLSPHFLFEGFDAYACKKIAAKKYSKEQLHKYMVTQTAYDEANHDFENNMLTHSKKRYEKMLELYAQEPQTKIGGATIGWTKEACKAGVQARQNAAKIQIPVLLLQAGGDEVVNAEAQNSFCQELSTCKKLIVEGAKHELFIESDSYRNRALEAILDFLESVV